MATDPTWLESAGGIAGVVAGLSGLIAAIAAWVKLGGRVDSMETDISEIEADVESTKESVQQLKMNEIEARTRRDDMIKVLEENRKDIKQILSQIAQLATMVSLGKSNDRQAD